MQARKTNNHTRKFRGCSVFVCCVLHQTRTTRWWWWWWCVRACVRACVAQQHFLSSSRPSVQHPSKMIISSCRHVACAAWLVGFALPCVLFPCSCCCCLPPLSCLDHHRDMCVGVAAHTHMCVLAAVLLSRGWVFLCFFVSLARWLGSNRRA